MIKGFVFFCDEKIPFALDGYRMDLFTDCGLLDDFSKKYNHKTNYILNGQYFRTGTHGQPATFLVDHSIGSTCYLQCYIVNINANEYEYDSIGFQSSFLDDVFRYKYNYLDMVRNGVNLAIEPKEAYSIPFAMNNAQYDLSFRLGHDARFGLLEDYDRKGEIIVSTQTNKIQECYDVSMVLYRLAMFMTSHAEVPFKRVTLYKNGWKIGWFYSPLISEEAVSGWESRYHEFDVLKYVPKILNNIALDSGNKITKSVPLGHLGDFESLFSPQRFMEQTMAFEYLFEKLEPQKAHSKQFPLKNELKLMFDKFPQLLSQPQLSSDTVSDQIKELRRTIAHGYSYYYTFKNDLEIQHLIVLLDGLIKKMSLLWIGFTEEEISDYSIY